MGDDGIEADVTDGAGCVFFESKSRYWVIPRSEVRIVNLDVDGAGHYSLHVMLVTGAHVEVKLWEPRYARDVVTHDMIELGTKMLADMKLGVDIDVTWTLTGSAWNRKESRPA